MNTECSFEPSKGGSTGYGEWSKAALIREVVVPQRSFNFGVGKRRYVGAVRSSRMGDSQGN